MTGLADTDPVSAELVHEAVPLFWGHRLRDCGGGLAEDLVLLFQVADLLTRRGELGGLGPAGPWLQAAVDEVLLLPAVQARLGDPEQLRDLGHGTARADQVQRPLPELRRVRPRHSDHFSSQKRPHSLNKRFRKTGA